MTSTGSVSGGESAAKRIWPYSKFVLTHPHVRQSSPDSGVGLQVKVLQLFQVVPFSLGSELKKLSLQFQGEAHGKTGLITE